MIAKLLVIAIYAAVLALVLRLPASFLGEDQAPRPWWRNVRFWAAFVAVVQMGVYAIWG
jgi:hypothetical protein